MLQSSPYLICLASCPDFIWVSRILGWPRPQLHLECPSRSRVLGPIHLGRAVSFTLASNGIHSVQFFSSCAQGWWSRPPVFVSKWTASPSIKFVGLASADYGFSLGAGKLLQSQLSHRSCYCCSSQWSTGPFNTIYRPLVQQCLSALNKDASWSVSCPFQKSHLTRFLEYLQCFLTTHLWIP